MTIIATGPSNGAKALAEATGILRVRPKRAYLNGSRIVVNWGCSDLVTRTNQTIFNPLEAVWKAANKALMMQEFSDKAVEIPDYDTDFTALRARNPGKRVIARRILNGSEGRGIEIVEPEKLPTAAAPLYVLYFPKKWEVRMHVFNGEVILTQQKFLPLGTPDKDNRTTEQRVVRSHRHGWRFRSTNLTVPQERLEKIKQQAIGAVRALGLDFGAVDLMLSENKTMVCEVNTRPGLDATATVEAYARKLKEL